MSHGRNSTIIMTHLLYLLDPILTFKVYCHFALFLQIMHRPGCFAVLTCGMAKSNCVLSQHLSAQC